jgi:LacI family transcriptional regulator
MHLDEWSHPIGGTVATSGVVTLECPEGGSEASTGSRYHSLDLMQRTRRIAVLMGQDLGYCRGVLRGVQAFSLEVRNWVFRDAPPEPEVVAALREWRPHGILAHLFSRELADELLALGTPIVNTTSTLVDLPIPLVEADHVGVGRMAADYFLRKGFRHFGYFGSSWTDFSKGREQGLRETVEAAGFRVLSCYAEYLPRPPLAASWRGVDQQLRRWLRALPKPVAILASNDVPARDLADMCRQEGMRVPEEVALMGVDNDELECNLCSPPLSSIEIPAQRIGYEAARVLEALMSGRKPKQQRQFLPPVRVVTRQSTDTVAIDDPDVSMALTIIRQHASEGIGVDEVLSNVPLSRRVLERRFRNLLGYTVLDEIRRARVEHAKQLLSETDLSMPRVASLCGFSNARRFAVVFNQFMHMTPSTYRSQCQLNDG